MSGPNFPPGSVGSGFSLNFFRPELRAANPASMPAHNQSRNIPPNRSPFLTCQAAQGGAQTTAISSQTQKHPATATIPNLTVITPNGGLVTAAAAAAANLPQFQHQSVLNSLFQTLLRGQNSIGGVSLAMPSANVNVSYINSVNSGVTGCTSVSSTPTASERFVTVSKPSPTMTNDPSQFHGSSRSVPTGVSPNSISLKLPVQKSGSGASTQKIVHQTGMNHVGLHPLPNSTVVSSDLTESCNPGVRATAITTNATSNTTNTANVAAQGGEQNSFHSLEMLFHPANIITIQPTLGPGKGTHPPIHKLGSMSFLRWASSGTRSFRRSRMSMWPRCHADLDALHGMSWIIAPTGLLGIYSDSPFLRPVLLLRRVQFATPGNPVSNFPDPDNMIRTLRELADAKVTKYSPFAPDYPTSATAVGFTTDYLSYVFTLDLDRLLVKILSEQLKPVNRRPPGPEWRVVLRLGWATTDFYIPPMHPDKHRQYRALIQEALPRCLSVRVGGRLVNLPDPIFHGGQAQRLGKRLRLSIDITDRLPIRPSNTIRNRIVDIEVSWLHAPLEDQSSALLDLVAGGQITPLLCHLIGLPLIQVTLDRLYSIHELQTALKPDPKEGCILDKCAFECMNNKDLLPLLVNSDGWPSDGQKGVWGTYDNCTPAEQLLTIDSVKRALKTKFEASMDDDLCITDGTSDGLDYIPICLLCPLTRTRIELPVRSIRCEHLQCFDFTAYLTINRRRPRWTCPICSVPSPFRDLRLDELSAAILADPITEGATFVHVDPSGQWRLAPEEGVDSHSATSHAPAVANAISHDSVNGPALLSPPRLVAVARSSNNSPNRSPSHMVNGDAEETPNPPSLVSPVKSAPVENIPPAVPSIDHHGDVEIIILSDDDDDDGVDTSGGQSNEPSGTAAVRETNGKSDAPQKESSVGPSQNTRAVSEINQWRNPDQPARGTPDELQIDLTNDDDEDEGEEDRRMISSAHGACSPSPIDQDKHSSSVTRSHGCASLDRRNPTAALPNVEDERLCSARPFIVISPLSTTVDDKLTGLSSSDARGNAVLAESLRLPGTTSSDKNRSDAARSTPGVNTNKSANYRHFFDTFSEMASNSRGSGNANAMVRRDSGSQHQDRTTSDGSGRSNKRRHTSDRRDDPDSPWRMIRPVSSYLQSEGRSMDDCVPGVDLFDYSDDEPAFSLDGSRHLPVTSSSCLSSLSVTDPHITTASGRHRPPILKEAQANALTRLMQQRAARPHVAPTGPVASLSSAAAANVPSTSSSTPATISQGRARKSTTRGNLSSTSRGRCVARRGGSNTNRSIIASTSHKRGRAESSRRGGTMASIRMTDDSESSHGSCFSSEMSCVSASDETSRDEQESDNEMNTEEEDDDSIDSDSSNDRWSPSRHGRANLTVDVRRGRVRRKHVSRR